MNNQIANIEELIDHLEKLGKGEIPPSRSCYGICTELVAVGGLGNMTRFVACRSKGWAHHSGNDYYPVPHPEWPYRPLKGFVDAGQSRWTDDEYGDLRRGLCLYLAQSLRDNPKEDW